MWLYVSWLFYLAAFASIIAMFILLTRANRLRRRISEAEWDAKFGHLRRTIWVLYVAFFVLLTLGGMVSDAPKPLAWWLKWFFPSLLLLTLRYGIFPGLAIEALYWPLHKYDKARIEAEAAVAAANEKMQDKDREGGDDTGPEEGGSHAPER